MNNEIYESSYQNTNHFSFGRNWKKFLESLNDRKVQEAKESLLDFLGDKESIKGRSFVDIGCGSGLFSYAAYKLGAARVVSVDVDEFSVACAEYLKEKEGNPTNWEIKKGSALSEEFIRSLGKFDIVYSWGVLHHTGDMWRAVDNVVSLVDQEGVFYLALYNKNEKHVFEGTSDLWVKLKRVYNSNGRITKKAMEAVYTTYHFLGMIFHGINPFSYVRNYVALRGMDFFTDIRDWLGGYPYEFASVSEVKYFLERSGLKCRKVREVRSIGCNEYLFLREKK